MQNLDFLEEEPDSDAVDAALSEHLDSVHLAAPVTAVLHETYGLTPEELALPERADDPQGMAFTDEQIAALTATDNEAAKALAFATATPEKIALLRATE